MIVRLNELMSVKGFGHMEDLCKGLRSNRRKSGSVEGEGRVQGTAGAKAVRDGHTADI